MKLSTLTELNRHLTTGVSYVLPLNYKCTKFTSLSRFKLKMMRPVSSGIAGVEPARHGPKPCVLPLYYIPIFYVKLFSIFSELIFDYIINYALF